LLAGDAVKAPKSNASSELFQPAPAIAGGRCLTKGLSGVDDVSIRARHCCVAAEPKLHVFSRGEHAYSSGSVFFPRWFLTRFLRSALCLLHTAVEVEQAVMVAALLDLIEERRWPKADNASA